MVEKSRSPIFRQIATVHFRVKHGRDLDLIELGIEANRIRNFIREHKDMELVFVRKLPDGSIEIEPMDPELKDEIYKDIQE